MKTKHLGIWMDHAGAHLMDVTSADMKTNTIESAFTDSVKETSLHKGEKNRHNKDQQEQLAYYHQIAAVIENCEKVLLFGPTSANTELLNVLKEDHRLDKIDIEIKTTGRMTQNKEHAFVKAYFFKHLFHGV